MKTIYAVLARYFCKKAGLILDSTVAFKSDDGPKVFVIKDGKLFHADHLPSITIWNRALGDAEIKDLKTHLK